MAYDGSAPQRLALSWQGSALIAHAFRENGWRPPGKCALFFHKHLEAHLLKESQPCDIVGLYSSPLCRPAHLLVKYTARHSQISVPDP